LRRDAPGKAASQYAEQLNKAIEEDDKDLDEEEEVGEEEDEGDQDKNYDVEMPDATQPQPVDAASTTAQRRRRKPSKNSSVWNLDIPLGTEHEAERWHNGEIAEVYEDALRTILRLQGEAAAGESGETQSDGFDGNALASTVGKAERASRAVEFVEKV
jgi:kinetochor protein Mis14/NSL1